MYSHLDPSALNHFTWDLCLCPLTLGKFNKVSVFINVLGKDNEGGVCTFCDDNVYIKANDSNPSSLLHYSANTEVRCCVHTRSGGGPKLVCCLCMYTILEVHSVASRPTLTLHNAAIEK